MYPYNFYSLLIPPEERTLPGREMLQACFVKASQQGWSDEVGRCLLTFLQSPLSDDDLPRTSHLADFLFCAMRDGRWQENEVFRRCIDEGIAILHKYVKICDSDCEEGHVRLLEDTFHAVRETAEELGTRLAKLGNKDRKRLFQGYLQVVGQALRVHEVCLTQHFTDELSLLEQARNYCPVSLYTPPKRQTLTVVKYARPRVWRSRIGFMNDWLSKARLYKLVAAPAGYGASQVAQVADAAYVAKGILYEMASKYAQYRNVYLARDGENRVQAIAIVTFESAKKSVSLDYLMTNPENLNVVECQDASRVRGAGTAIVMKVAQDALQRSYTAIFVHPLDSSVNWYREQFGFEEIMENTYVLRASQMRALLTKASSQKVSQSV